MVKVSKPRICCARCEDAEPLSICMIRQHFGIFDLVAISFQISHQVKVQLEHHRTWPYIAHSAPPWPLSSETPSADPHASRKAPGFCPIEHLLSPPARDTSPQPLDSSPQNHNHLVHPQPLVPPQPLDLQQTHSQTFDSTSHPHAQHPKTQTTGGRPSRGLENTGTSVPLLHRALSPYVDQARST